MCINHDNTFKNLITLIRFFLRFDYKYKGSVSKGYLLLRACNKLVNKQCFQCFQNIDSVFLWW